MSLALIRVVCPGTDPRQTTDPSHCGTPLSSGSWEVQFQDIVIEQKNYYNKSVYVVVDTNSYCTAL